MDLERLLSARHATVLSAETIMQLYKEEKKRFREERAEVREAAKEQEEIAKPADERAYRNLMIEKELTEKKLQLRALSSAEGTGAVSYTAPQRVDKVCSQKFIAPFDERRDDLDAYIQRFERIATLQGWQKSDWATGLSMCLVGEALAVFSRMPAADALDYDKLKVALLQRRRLTAEGSREKFRTSKPQENETGQQFAARISNYFDRWLEMGKVKTTFEDLRDSMMAEQFLASCHPGFTVFLRQCNLKTVAELAEHADRYWEAEGQKNLVKRKEEKETEEKEQTRSTAECFLCSKAGHRAASCQLGRVSGSALQCGRCGRRGHTAETCRAWPQNETACVVAGESPLDGHSTKEIHLKESRDETCAVTTAVRSEDTGTAMPVVAGILQGQQVSVLRDTGSNIVLVRQSMVSKTDFTGREAPVRLADGTVRRMPVARVLILTPYYCGWIEARCVEDPTYNVILGNVPGVRRVDNPDPLWSIPTTKMASGMKPEVTKVRNKRDNGSGNLVTREDTICSAEKTARIKNKREDDKRDTIDTILNVTEAEIRQKQEADNTLRRAFKAQGKWVHCKKSRRMHKFENVGGLLYRAVKTHDRLDKQQLVVPAGLGRAVLNLAHDSILAKHQGVRKTTNRVAEDFFLPYMQSDVNRFVRSCRKCRTRTPQDLGRVKKWVEGLGSAGAYFVSRVMHPTE